MKHHNTVYFFGSVLLFLGLFWMFLPHAYHNTLITIPPAENQEHIVDIFEGVAAALGGLGFMVLSNQYAEQHEKKEKKAYSADSKKP